MVFDPTSIEEADWHSYALLQTTLDGILDPIFVKDRRHCWVAFNEAFCALLGRPREEVLGRSDPDFFPPEQVEVFWRVDDEVFRSGAPNENEEFVTDGAGVVRTIWTRKTPLKNARGEVVGLCGVITDVTELKERTQVAERIEAENREQRATLAAQTAMLDALAMPVVEVWDGVLLMSLIGELSERRAAQAMQGLLAAIGRGRARFVLIDVTGIPAVDTTIAATLQRTTRAAGLLGCASVLCGIGPAIARTLVELRFDLGGVTVCGTVRAGLAHALGRPGG